MGRDDANCLKKNIHLHFHRRLLSMPSLNAARIHDATVTAAFRKLLKLTFTTGDVASVHIDSVFPILSVC